MTVKIVLFSVNSEYNDTKYNGIHIIRLKITTFGTLALTITTLWIMTLIIMAIDGSA